MVGITGAKTRAMSWAMYRRGLQLAVDAIDQIGVQRPRRREPGQRQRNRDEQAQSRDESDPQRHVFHRTSAPGRAQDVANAADRLDEPGLGGVDLAPEI